MFVAVLWPLLSFTTLSPASISSFSFAWYLAPWLALTFFGGT